jgi:hypothetical protein
VPGGGGGGKQATRELFDTLLLGERGFRSTRRATRRSRFP